MIEPGRTGAYLALFSEIGIILLVTTLAGALGGHWVDLQLGVTPLFLLAGLLGGLAAGALAVYRLRSGPFLGQAGRAGGLVLMAGMVLYIAWAGLAGLGVGWPWLPAIAGQVLTTIGLAALGLGALAQAPREPWKWIPLLLAPVYYLSFSSIPESFPPSTAEYLPQVFALIYGAGWVLFGLLLPRKMNG